MSARQPRQNSAAIPIAADASAEETPPSTELNGQDTTLLAAQTANQPARLDPVVVAQLFHDYSDELRSFLLGVLCNLDLANEVLQATFARVVEHGHTAHTETIKGWLFRVAFNEAMTLRRRATVRNKAAVLLREQGEPIVESPENFLLLRESTSQVQQALLTLPAELQQIVRMRIYEERTLATIASELGLPLGTVYARLQLALKKLKSCLTPKP
jgi:RNA polymerase sigma factor (sigma-70 family)